MTSKRSTTPEPADEPDQAPRLPPPTANASPSWELSPLPSANAPLVYFEDAPVYAYNIGHGVGSITLATRRQILNAAGQPAEDRMMTAMLRGSLPALLSLRTVINDIERMANEQMAAAVAVSTMPDGRPH